MKAAMGSDQTTGLSLVMSWTREHALLQMPADATKQSTLLFDCYVLMSWDQQWVNRQSTTHKKALNDMLGRYNRFPM